MLQKYNESDFELFYLDKGRLSFLKKFSKINKQKSVFFFKFLVDIYLFFSFCNIVNIELFYIQRFFLLLWLFTGCLGYVVKFKSHLRLGKYYYHFIIKYLLKKRKFFYFLSFLLDDFLKKKYIDSFFLQKTKYILVFNDLQILTNKKLARGVYFHRIQQLLYMNINILEVSSIYFLNYLNQLKLLKL